MRAKSGNVITGTLGQQRKPKATYFRAGNSKLTRRVKALSLLRGFPVTEDRHFNNYGHTTRGYECHPDVYREVTEVIAREAGRAKAKAKAEALAVQAEAYRREADLQRRLALEAILHRRFPLLPVAVLDECLDRRATAYGPGDPIPVDVYTARQWSQLGCRVRKDATPVGYTVRTQGAVFTPLFRPAFVSATASRKAAWDSARLWEFWRGEFRTDLLALATAVRVANRLVKFAPFASHKAGLYSAKDRFIRYATPYLRDCRVSRLETSDCWSCDGEGCFRCEGSGVYSERTLYEYLFLIDGEEFCVHSYVLPPAASLSAEPGADLPHYGRRFTPAALARVKLRVPEFVRLIDCALNASG